MQIQKHSNKEIHNKTQKCKSQKRKKACISKHKNIQTKYHTTENEKSKTHKDKNTPKCTNM